jgi:hypothetical protein
MLILKCALQGMEFVAVGKTFHGVKIGAVGLDREHQAGTHRFAVKDNGAGAAHSMLTTQMSSGEIQLLANEIGQGHSDFDEPLVSPAVDRDLDRLLTAQ